MALQEFQAFDSEAEAKRNVVRAIEAVAEKLGNTPAVSRASYVHPTVIDAYLEGDLLRQTREEADRALSERISELQPEEAAVLALLRKRLADEEHRAARRRRAA
jgi:DNA topoisomerase-1